MLEREFEGGLYRDDVRALNSRKSPMARKISLSEDSRFERAVSAIADAFAAVVILEGRISDPS